MKIIKVWTKKEKQLYLRFRDRLYQGDALYFSTSEFVFQMLMDQTTQFTKNLTVEPTMVMDQEQVLCQALFLIPPNEPELYIAYFEALENQEQAVQLLLSHAKRRAQECGKSKIIIGLNGHVSYGVGMLYETIYPNTFDSLYNKLYYHDYFKSYPHTALYAYKGDLNTIPRLPNVKTKLTVRPCNLKNFAKEMEVFRLLCDQTLGEHAYYKPTQEQHFHELMKDLRLFLKPENILFLEDGYKPVGFLFWHPDYNQMLKPGKRTGMLEIGLRYLFYRHKFSRVKLNAMGVLPAYRGKGTIALLDAFYQQIKGRYSEVETNFVFADNAGSIKLNQHLLKQVCRKYHVYQIEVDHD